jgi:hypothetical protein
MENYECEKYLDHRLTMPVIPPSNCSQVTVIATPTSEAGFFTIAKASTDKKSRINQHYTQP